MEVKFFLRRDSNVGINNTSAEKVLTFKHFKHLLPTTTYTLYLLACHGRFNSNLLRQDNENKPCRSPCDRRLFSASLLPSPIDSHPYPSCRYMLTLPLRSTIDARRFPRGSQIRNELERPFRIRMEGGGSTCRRAL